MNILSVIPQQATPIENYNYPQKIKIIDMKKTIKIPEGHYLRDNKDGSYSIVPEESKYPMELADIPVISVMYANGKEDLWNKYETFIRLVETCKEWNRIDGFEADWNNSIQNKWCVYNTRNELKIFCCLSTCYNLYFIEHQTAELFLETFREEIELVKDLI